MPRGRELFVGAGSARPKPAMGHIAYLSSRQSAAPNAAGIDNAGSKWSREAQTKFVPRGLRQDSIINGSLFYSSQGRADPAPTVILYSCCCRSIMYFCCAKVPKRPAHGKSSQAALCLQAACDILRSSRLWHCSLSVCCRVLRN